MINKPSKGNFREVFSKQHDNANNAGTGYSKSRSTQFNAQVEKSKLPTRRMLY